MTGMLASVSSVLETDKVLQAEVDIVDIKNPLAGALGAVEIETVRSIVERVAGRVPTSATVGDVEQNDPRLPELIEDIAATGVDFVKVGLFADVPDPVFINLMRAMVKCNHNIVIVTFAEHYHGSGALQPLLETGIAGIMMDTRGKEGQSLLDIINPAELGTFVERAHVSHLLAGLAGSLRQEHIGPLLDYKPDYLGFRGALCANDDRVNAISAEMVGQIRAAIPKKDNIHYHERFMKQATH